MERSTEEETEQSLNYDFNYNLVIGKSMMGNLTLPQERQLATDWLQKLSTCGNSMEELRLRNAFAYLLIVAMQDGQLRPPFDAEPPVAPLTSLHHLLARVAESGGDWMNIVIDPGEAYGGVDDSDQDAEQDGEQDPEGPRPPMFEHSPDGGAFLAAQPVPRCGAFCYLAVVARQDQ